MVSDFCIPQSYACTRYMYSCTIVSTCTCATGVYAGDSTSTDSQLFICEYHALTDLLNGMKTPCTCGVSTHLWIIDSLVQVHVCTATSIICIMDM